MKGISGFAHHHSFTSAGVYRFSVAQQLPLDERITQRWPSRSPSGDGPLRGDIVYRCFKRATQFAFPHFRAENAVTEAMHAIAANERFTAPAVVENGSNGGRLFRDFVHAASGWKSG